MPVLDNPRHEIFAQHIAKGSSQRDAYAAAGDEAKNLKATDASASRLLTDANVLARIKEIQVVGARKAEVTTESILAELEEARLLALSLDQPAAAVAASMGKAKVSGNIVQRHEHGKPGDFSHLNDEELKSAIVEQTKELAELDPEFAEFTKQLVQQKRATKH